MSGHLHLPRTLLTLALAATLTAATAATPAQAQYKILQTAKVGGDGGFDYVTADATARRLYVSRSGPAGALHVFNLDTLAPLGDIALGSSHGAAIDTELHHGFATSKPVTMFDTETLKVLKVLDTAGNPDGYLADPVAHKVYILSHAAPNVTVLDAHDGAILATIDLGGAPEQSALDSHGHLFIDLEDKDAIAVVDTKTNTVTGKYSIAAKGGGCAGLALDDAHNVLFAACRDKNNMIIVSSTDGHIITSLPIGIGSDGAVFNPATHEAFSSQGDGTLTIIKESASIGATPTAADFSIEQTVTTPPRAKTLTLDSKTNHILLITAEFGPPPAPAAPAAAGAPPARPGRAPMIPGSFSIVVVGK